MLTRRHLMAGTGLALLGQPLRSRTARAESAPPLPDLGAELARLEAESRGRLGVAVIDTGSGRRIGHRADERFPMCSTGKLLDCGATLARVDSGRDNLDRRIHYKASDLVTYSPVTQLHVDDGMTLADVCAAAITVSDNTAANLLVGNLGGPQAVTAFTRSLGDPVTRADRLETALNEAIPGDPRDTTTPNAMADNLRALVLGEALSPGSRERLTAWMVANTTGDAKLRAGLPAGWRVGDKTGSGAHGSSNDVAVLWPPGRAPLVVTVYLTGAETIAEAARSAVIASVGRAVSAALAT